MNHNQVLSEIEKVIDFRPDSVKLLSTKQAMQYERDCVYAGLGGTFEPLYKTAPHRNNNFRTQA